MVSAGICPVVFGHRSGSATAVDGRSELCKKCTVRLGGGAGRFHRLARALLVNIAGHISSTDEKNSPRRHPKCSCFVKSCGESARCKQLFVDCWGRHTIVSLRDGSQQHAGASGHARNSTQPSADTWLRALVDCRDDEVSASRNGPPFRGSCVKSGSGHAAILYRSD